MIPATAVLGTAAATSGIANTVTQFSQPGNDGQSEEQQNNGEEKPSSEQEQTTPEGRVLTTHSQEDSLPRHGFQEPYNEVDNIIDNPSRVRVQEDGAIVYIQRTGGRNRLYNIAIVNEADPQRQVIVTAMKNLTPSELRQLARKYGFDPNL